MTNSSRPHIEQYQSQSLKWRGGWTRPLNLKYERQNCKLSHKFGPFFTDSQYVASLPYFSCLGFHKLLINSTDFNAIIVVFWRFSLQKIQNFYSRQTFADVLYSLGLNVYYECMNEIQFPSRPSTELVPGLPRATHIMVQNQIKATWSQPGVYCQTPANHPATWPCIGCQQPVTLFILLPRSYCATWSDSYHHKMPVMWWWWCTTLRLAV